MQEERVAEIVLGVLNAQALGTKNQLPEVCGENEAKWI